MPNIYSRVQFLVCEAEEFIGLRSEGENELFDLCHSMVLLSVIAFRYMEENTGTGSAVLFASRESNVDNGVGAVSDLGHWSSRGGGDWRTALKSSSMNVKMGTRCDVIEKSESPTT